MWISTDQQPHQQLTFAIDPKMTWSQLWIYLYGYVAGSQHSVWSSLAGAHGAHEPREFANGHEQLAIHCYDEDNMISTCKIYLYNN